MADVTAVRFEVRVGQPRGPTAAMGDGVHGHQDTCDKENGRSGETAPAFQEMRGRPEDPDGHLQ